MKKICLANFLILFVPFIVQSQEVLVPNATAGYHTSSPETIGANKQNSIPVNLSTGVPQIGIPIASLQGRSISVGFSLNYDASGRKADEIAQYTGWGWNLVGGGQINRVVKGKQDEYNACINHAYQNQDGYSELIYWNWKNVIDGNELNKSYVTNIPSYNNVEKRNENFSSEINDFQPDEYHFSFNGRSGMFVINNQGEPVLIPHQNLKVEFQECLHWFKITDENGFVYQYGLPACSEFGVNNGQPNTKAATTWHLLTIKNPYGEIEFTFNYGPELSQVTNNRVNTRTYYSGSTDCPADLSVNTVYYTKYYYRRLSSVVSSTGSRLEFYSTNSRLDIPSDKSLDEVWLFDDQSQLQMKCLLSYGYFLNQNGGNERLKLNNVKNRTASGEERIVSSFIYNDATIFDNELIAGKDHWGYYNGLNDNSVQDIHVNGGKRRVDPAFNQIGILQEIISPTGAKTIFEYETNTYSQSPDGLVTELSPLGQQTVSCISDADEDDVFKYKESISNPWTYIGPTSGYFPDEDDYPDPNCTNGYTFHNPAFSYNVGPENGSDGVFLISNENDIDHPNHPNNTDLYDLEISYVPIPKSKISKKLFTIDAAQTIVITGTIAKSLCTGHLSAVKIINHNSPQNEVWSITGSVSQSTSVNQSLAIQPGTYELICITKFPRFNNIEPGYVPNNLTISEFITEAQLTFTPMEIPQPSTGNRYAGGLRIKRLITKDGDSNPQDNSVTLFEYDQFNQPGLSSGYLFSDPKYDLELFYYYDQYKRTGGGCGGGMQLCHECDFKQHISSGINSLITVNGAFHVYRNVRTKVCDYNGNCTNGWTDEEFSFENSYNAHPVIQAAKPFSNWNVGLSLKTKVFNQNGHLVRELNNKYSDLFVTPTAVSGINAGVTNVESVAPNEPQCEMNSHECSYLMDYLISYYSYQSNGKILTKSDNKLYDQLNHDKLIETSTAVDYHSEIPGLMTRSITSYSDLSLPITVKTVKYVGDYLTGNLSGVDNMTLSLDFLINTGKFGLTTPVETIMMQGSSLNDLKVIGGELQSFKVENGRVVPDAIYKLELEEPISENEFTWSSVVGSSFTFDPRYRRIAETVTYDSQWRPVCSKKENDIPNSVIRDYPDGRVVAEIVNAEADECAYTSFETTNPGGWIYQNQWTSSSSFSHLGFNLKKAKTGLRAYDFQGGSIAKTVKPGKYIVSMWSTSPAFSLSVDGQVQSRHIEQDGQDVMGWAYYEYLIDCTNQHNISISSSSGVLLDELRLYPFNATMKTIAFNSDGTIRTECGINNRCTTYLYDSWKRLEWTLDDSWEILSYNEYHIKNQNDPNDHSWTKQKVVMVSGINRTNVINATAYNENVLTSISYSDGLGRPLQEIAVNQSPQKRDIISFHVYDELGRESKQYAPFTRQGNIGEFVNDVVTKQAYFYEHASKIAHSEYPFAETSFENSPLNRVLVQGSIGEDWQIDTDHAMKYFSLLK